MSLHMDPSPQAIFSRRPSAFRFALPVAFALTVGLGVSQSSAAAEIDLAGTGTFKSPSSAQLASLPAGMAFSQADLTSGTWSFLVRYDDQTADTDPDPYVGRYVGAIRLFRLTIGATTVDLAVNQAQLIVSDGGLGFPDRESIRIETSMPTAGGVMQVGWIQSNQTPSGTDLRGDPGSLRSDAIPQPSTIANLATSRPFDRFLLLRIDVPNQTLPLLYITSSHVSVVAHPAPAR